VREKIGIRRPRRGEGGMKGMGGTCVIKGLEGVAPVFLPEC